MVGVCGVAAAFMAVDVGDAAVAVEGEHAGAKHLVVLAVVATGCCCAAFLVGSGACLR
jgi:hypothetical protein